VALAVAVGGCGSATHTGSQTGANTVVAVTGTRAGTGTAGTGTVPGAGNAAVPARLQVAYTAQRRDPGGKQVWTLRCDPTGGSHPLAAVACSELAAHPQLLLGSGRGQIRCMLVIANGPTVAVTGTVEGKRVRYSPSSACDPAWNELRVLLTGSRAKSG
jgi:hypothetical protein